MKTLVAAIFAALAMFSVYGVAQAAPAMQVCQDMHGRTVSCDSGRPISDNNDPYVEATSPGVAARTGLPYVPPGTLTVTGPRGSTQTYRSAGALLQQRALEAQVIAEAASSYVLSGGADVRVARKGTYWVSVTLPPNWE